jgi:hypothetical protein
MMSMHPISFGVFSPEEVELLGRVYKDTLASARLRQSDDDLVDDLLERLIATEIIKLAKIGERDPRRLQSLTLAKLRLSHLQVAS